MTATDVDGDALTFYPVGTPTYGVLDLHPDGTFTYTPNTGVESLDTFVFVAADEDSQSQPTYIPVTIGNINQPPDVLQANYTTTEDTSVSGVVQAFDINGDPITFSLVRQPYYGSVDFHPDGTFTYTPAPNYNGPDWIAFRASDHYNPQAPAYTDSAININVIPAADTPVANSVSFATYEDVLFEARLTGSDADDDALTFSLATSPAHGSVVVNPDGTFTYTPMPITTAATASPSSANDGTTDSAPAAVDLTIENINDPPVVNPASFNTDEDTPLDGTLTGSDIDGPSFTFYALTDPAHGTVEVHPDGTFTYTPNANYSGSDSFTFGATDGGNASLPATVLINIAPLSDPPTANPGSFTTNEDVTLNGNLSGTDVDGNPLTFALVTGAAHGTVTVNPNGTFKYIPVANYNGPDSFTFRVNDGQGNSAPATVSLTVAPVNDAPTASGSSISMSEDGVVNAFLAGADIDGDTLAFVVGAAPTHGTLQLNTDGTFSYTPDANYNGPDSFTFRTNDGQANSALATATISVRPVNDAPTANGASLGTDEDTPLNGTLTGTDVDGDGLTFALATGPAHGSVVVNPNGTFTYTPNANYHGPDTFTFRTE